MSLIKLLARLTTLSMVCLTMVSCAIFSKSTDQLQPPVSFEQGVTALAASLLNQIKADRHISAGKADIKVMIIPFPDADSDQVPEISRRIEEILIETGSGNFKGIELARLTYQNIGRADYTINGTIGLEEYTDKDAGIGGKYYRIYGEARKLADAKVIGQSSVWIADMDLNYTPTAIYRDSPLYFKGSRLALPEKSRSEAAGELFFDMSLKTRAILIEGRMAYEKGDYAAARKLFTMAAERKDGQDLETYAGLYLANQKLGRFADAEKAFHKVVSISVEKHRYLTIKYLFGVGSVDFLKDPGLRTRYDAWIRNIGKYFHTTDHCLRIVGHASRTGTADYNKQLSLKRAKNVQKRLSKTFPEVYKRSKVEGRGYSQNIMGVGTDDQRDELDRRVELFIIDCKE